MPRSPRAKTAGASARPGTATSALHPRNRHHGRYDLAALAAAEPAFAAFVVPGPDKTLTIDFSNPLAVTALNRALLQNHYGISDWDLPPGYLCPPIPGRADYVHYAADLLAADAGGRPPRGEAVRVLDIGTGANLVYPLLGQHEYGWSFVGTDIDEPALLNAEHILHRNPQAATHISLQMQVHREQMLRGIIQPEERFALTLCNPPFHASLADARAGTERKLRGLAANAAKNDSPLQQQRVKPRANDNAAALNFGGQTAELTCPGGELQFIQTLIAESVLFKTQVLWFSTLVSKSANLPAIYRALDSAGIDSRKTVTMAQGQKQSRFVAWSFLPAAVRTERLRALSPAR